MNILLSLNRKYHKQMVSLINSILDNNAGEFNFYVFSKDLSYFDLDIIKKHLIRDVNFSLVNVDDSFLSNAPVTKRYPLEIYYRIFASKLLPTELDKILYLDCDIIVKGDLKKIYDLEFDDNLYIATTNVGEFLNRFNQIKNNASKDTQYINTGILLMNLKLLRSVQNFDDVYNFIDERGKYFTLPDQDIISTLYGARVKIIDNLVFNLSDRAITLNNLKLKNINNQIDLDWVEKNAVIIHYYGKNKPWNDNYTGILDIYYHKYEVLNDLI